MFTSNILIKFVRNTINPVRAKKVPVVRRNVVDVYTSEEYEEHLNSKSKKNTKSTKNSKKIQVPNPEKPKDANIVPKQVLQLKYKKLRDTPGNAFYQLVYNTKVSSYRQTHKLCLLMGGQLVKTVMEEGEFIKTLYFNRLHKLEMFSQKLLRSQKVFLIHIPDRVMKIFPKSSCDGLFAMARIPGAKSRQKILDKRRTKERKRQLKILPVTVVCNGITDPVEMGEIVRMAENACCEQIYAMDGCIDAWGLDTLVTAQGSQFKIPIFSNMSLDKLPALRNGKAVCLLHDSDSDITLRTFVAEEEYQNYQRSSNFVDMLQKESNLEFRGKEDVSKRTISSMPFNEIRLNRPTLLLIGHFGIDEFQALTDAKTLATCFAAHIPRNIASNRLEQLSVVLQEGRRQQNIKNEVKENIFFDSRFEDLPDFSNDFYENDLDKTQ